MAQAVFDEHPLEAYLRESGETPELMPGGSSEFIESDDLVVSEEAATRRSGYIGKATIVIQSMFARLTHRTPPFVERFKYDIISSSLLSDSLAPGTIFRLPATPTFPGNISSHESSCDAPTAASSVSQNLPTTAAPPSEYWISSLALVLVALSLSAGYYVLAILAIGGTIMTAHLETMEVKQDMKPSMDAVKELIFAGTVWDSVVQEVLTILEKEETHAFSAPRTPTFPSSSLRVALNSTLHTTQTQCDNVRQLFAALTSPSELSQLSEMYAPPSHQGSSHSSPNTRPLSLPTTPPRSRGLATAREDKRSTWNGSYSSLASAGSPTPQFLKRREKRRSDLSSLLGSGRSSVSTSAPVTPIDSDLFGVAEDDEDRLKYEGDRHDLSLGSDDSFGFVALDLQRKRKSGAFHALGFSTRPRTNTFSSASKFTAVQPSRHPLSLSTLHSALQSALASKRYACSHLLALRFDEEDDDSYWEDVQSVMSLLTSTLADAAARLTDALEENERLHLRFENPSPDSLPSHSRSASANFDVPKRTSTMDHIISFAPVPSQMARFGAHVDALSSALNDARENMDACVDALRTSQAEDTPVQEHPALQAYERLRRELGLALRECERGRERLLEIVSPPKVEELHGDDRDDEDIDDLPSLGSSEQDQDADPDSSSLDEPHPAEVEPMHGAVSVHDNSEEKLPPPGIEQVFEGDSGQEVLWTRERAKLSREERIRLAKEKRESQTAEDYAREQWGPGGEVVQELKDVIWKVGEKRRRMTSGSSLSAPPPPSEPDYDLNAPIGVAL